MQAISEHFETKERANGDRFSTLKDDAPEWLGDAVYDAHNGCLPNDWVYEMARAAVCAIEEGSLNEDSLGEWCDGMVDVYTKDLFGWSEQFCLTDLFSLAEEEVADMGAGDVDVSLEGRIRIIQYCAIQRIALVILSAYEEPS